MIKAEMIYALDDTRAFLRRGSGYARFRIPIAVITAAAVILTLVLLLIPSDSAYKDDIGFTLIISIAGILLYTLWFVDRPEKLFRRMRGSFGDIPTVYSFADEILTVSFSSALVCSINKYKYQGFKLCIETDEHFFIWINAYSGYIIRKNSLTEGTPEELRAELQKVLGERYRIKVKK